MKISNYAIGFITLLSVACGAMGPEGSSDQQQQSVSAQTSVAQPSAQASAVVSDESTKQSAAIHEATPGPVSSTSENVSTQEVPMNDLMGSCKCCAEFWCRGIGPDGEPQAPCFCTRCAPSCPPR